VGNIRKLPDRGYRLRFARHGERRTSPEVYRSRADAERARWKIMADGRADFVHDRRYRALVLLAPFASLRWGEVTALRRCDVDLQARSLRVRAAYVERLTGEMVLGPSKSRAGRRVVGIPDAIIPVLREHLAAFVKDEPGALVFPGPLGGPVRRGNFNKMSGWPHAVRAIGMEGLHFHDLRHAGNHFAAASGAALRDLMARMGKSVSKISSDNRLGTGPGGFARAPHASTGGTGPHARPAAALGLADETTPLPPPVCVVRSRACASPLRSAAPSRLALPPSPPPPFGEVLTSRPQGQAPLPDSRAPDRGRPRPWS
jgi:hypothetical protein